MTEHVEGAETESPDGRLNLSLQDVPLIIGITYRTVCVMLLQNRLPIPRLVEYFDSRRKSPRNGRAKLARVRRLTDGLLHVLFGGAYCMKRSLILFHYARRYGLDVRVVFGVANHGKTLKGHAWLELDGRPYRENEGAIEGFKTIYSHPVGEDS